MALMDFDAMLKQIAKGMIDEWKQEANKPSLFLQALKTEMDGKLVYHPPAPLSSAPGSVMPYTPSGGSWKYTEPTTGTDWISTLLAANIGITKDEIIERDPMRDMVRITPEAANRINRKPPHPAVLAEWVTTFLAAHPEGITMEQLEAAGKEIDATPEEVRRAYLETDLLAGATLKLPDGHPMVAA